MNKNFAGIGTRLLILLYVEKGVGENLGNCTKPTLRSPAMLTTRNLPEIWTETWTPIVINFLTTSFCTSVAKQRDGEMKDGNGSLA